MFSNTHIRDFRWPNVKRIMLPIEHGFIWLNPFEILYIRASADHTEVILLCNESIPVLLPITKIAFIIPPHRFCRVHPCYIVNRGYVKKLVRNGNGYIVMEGGTEVPISKDIKRGEIDRIASTMEIIE